jgi:transketolase
LVGAHGGLLTGRQGASHQALEDIGMMRAIPGMTVVSPADYEEAWQATLAIAKHKGPVYLRLGREKIPSIYGNKYRFQLGKGVVMRQGKDVAIIATGPMVNVALEAHKLLSKQGIYARVINIHTIKPLDKGLIIRAAKETKGIITAEDHSIIGGLGSAVAEVLSEQCPTKLIRIGVKDRFGNSGKPFELYEKYGLSAQRIADHAKKIL